MTGKQQAFVEHYCGDCNYNGHKSALAAGYSKKTANAISAENLSKPIIKKAISKKMAELAEKIELSVEFIVQKLLLGLQLAEQKKDLVAMARFSELLGKHKAMFTDVHKDAGADIPKPISPEDIDTLRAIAKAVTDAELAKPKLVKDIA